MSESQRAGKGPSQQTDSETTEAVFSRHKATIPVPFTSLVGRVHEIEQVMDLLRSGEARLITLTGPGGVGKTRLALQVAAQARGLYGHGAFFLPLADISDPALLLPHIAQTLGVVEKAGETTLQALCTAMGSRHMLLILDNFEQILPAGPTVLELLQCAPRLQVLITSRAALRVYGEQEYPVTPLSIPRSSAEASLEALTQYDSVRLFIARARAVKPGFSVTSSTAPAVAEICHRLDGLPLAIELAAARIKLLSPRALLKRLDRSLPLLTCGAATLPYRHQTLRDAIAWSYNLLTEEEQRVFRCLSIFSGGCTLEAAQAVCGPGRVLTESAQEPEGGGLLDTLSALVDKSLVRHTEQDDGEPRFSLLETIREFSWEQLESRGEDETAAGRHIDYFTALAEQSLSELLRSNQASWLEKIALDYDNMRAVFARVFRSGDAKAGLRLGVALWNFWNMRGYGREGCDWLKQALEQAEDAPDGLRAQALRTFADLSIKLGDYATSRRCLEQALAICKDLGDKHGTMRALRGLANTARLQGDFASARTLFEEAALLSRELGEVTNLSLILSGLGSVVFMLGRQEEARRIYQEALELHRALGNTHGITIVLHRLGTLAVAQGNIEEGRALHKQALDLSQKLRDDAGIARSLLALGNLAADEGDYASARSLVSRSLELRLKAGNKRTIAEKLLALAVVDRERSEPARLVTLLAQSDALFASVNAGFAPHEEALKAKWLGFARTMLDSTEYVAAWERGVSMSLDDAVALALGPASSNDIDTPADQWPLTSEPAVHLTSREIEVLRLVAVGLTNPGIAAQLHVSINTVQTHMRSIFTKINVTTRGAAIRYLFEHNLR